MSVGAIAAMAIVIAVGHGPTLADQPLRSKAAFFDVVAGKAITNTIPFFASTDWEVYGADGTWYFLAQTGELVAVGAWDFFDGKLCKSLASEFLDRYEVPSDHRFHSRMPCGTVTLTDDNVLLMLPEAAEEMVERGLDAVTVSAHIEEPEVLQTLDLSEVLHHDDAGHGDDAEMNEPVMTP